MKIWPYPWSPCRPRSAFSELMEPQWLWMEPTESLNTSLQRAKVKMALPSHKVSSKGWLQTTVPTEMLLCPKLLEPKWLSNLRSQSGSHVAPSFGGATDAYIYETLSSLSSYDFFLTHYFLNSLAVSTSSEYPSTLAHTQLSCSP